MTPAEINALEARIFPWARWRYAKEFAALRAGTSLGELERQARRHVTADRVEAATRRGMDRQQARVERYAAAAERAQRALPKHGKVNAKRRPAA